MKTVISKIKYAVLVYLLLLNYLSSYSQEKDTTIVIGNDSEEIFSRPYTFVEQMPTFPEGEEALHKFLADSVKYPQLARETGIQGTVYVTFVINEKGYVKNAQILRGIGAGCEEEAIRVVRKMPAWKPGKQSGKPVAVQFNLPIKFILEK